MSFKELFYCRNASTICINSNFPLRKPEMAVSTLFESVVMNRLYFSPSFYMAKR